MIEALAISKTINDRLIRIRRDKFLFPDKRFLIFRNINRGTLNGASQSISNELTYFSVKKEGTVRGAVAT
jgi:hypothetical protein